MKVLTVVGTRPEFVQTAPVSQVLRQNLTEILVHTGQHFDHNMSDVFFTELGLPQPEYNLDVGGGTHAQQTCEIMTRIEKVMQSEKPDWVLVYGDTNSTVAASLTAAKLYIPVAHIEAGLRSFDRMMPEEVNRVITDHLSTALFSPTQAAIENLKQEGIIEGVYLVGDVRVDLLTHLSKRDDLSADSILSQANIGNGAPFALATIHRPVNTDDSQQLKRIINCFGALDFPILFPVHPRLKKMLEQFSLSFTDNVRLIEPLSMLEIVAIMDACELVITDSGGLQKEAYILHRPTVTLRNTTEWIETVEAGWNRLCDADVTQFVAAVVDARENIPASHPDYYGTYGVSERICQILQTNPPA